MSLCAYIHYSFVCVKTFLGRPPFLPFSALDLAFFLLITAPLRAARNAFCSSEVSS